jgi:hypothetical protein
MRHSLQERRQFLFRLFQKYIGLSFLEETDGISEVFFGLFFAALHFVKTSQIKGCTAHPAF